MQIDLQVFEISLLFLCLFKNMPMDCKWKFK